MRMKSDQITKLTSFGVKAYHICQGSEENPEADWTKGWVQTVYLTMSEMVMNGEAGRREWDPWGAGGPESGWLTGDGG